MPFTLHSVVVRGNSLLIEFELAKKADSILFEAVFRDLISARLSIDTSWGLDDSGKPTGEARYPVGQVLRVIYNGDSKEIAITYIEKPVISKKEFLANIKPDNLRKTG